MYDVVIVGGGVAGLSAALILGRARRRVLVLDAGEPRNASAEHAHGFLSRDGTPPGELLRLAREELTPYDSVTLASSYARSAEASAAGFSIELDDGSTIQARKLLLATGVTDVLPEVPGLRELWGRGVHHCPYCHGWEVRDKVWAILGDAPFAFERVMMFAAGRKGRLSSQTGHRASRRRNGSALPRLVRPLRNTGSPASSLMASTRSV